MRLCLVRHAIAVARESWEGNDAERPLTERGRERMQIGARGLARCFVPEIVFSSPLLRALDTAEILTGVYQVGRPVLRQELASGEHHTLLEAIADSDASSAMVVGHEPHISELLSLLITGNPDSTCVQFKKGGAALVESDGQIEAGRCNLLWFLPPAILRELATR